MASRDYTATISAIKSQGYNVKFVQINWSRTTIEQWSKELDKVYASYDPNQTILAGFSYGAVTVFMSATKSNPSELWLFSLSPYFAEDLKNNLMEASWLKNIGHRRVTAFSQLDFEQLSKAITCRTLLFVGQLEIDKWPIMGERSHTANRLLADSELFVVADAGHDVANRKYIDTIRERI